MTVKELKAQLDLLPQDLEVKILMSDDFYGISIAQVVDATFDKREYVVAICSDEEL